MEREKILKLLKSQKRRLKKFGVRSISVFGSVARNKIRKQSDVDLLVEFDKPVGLFEFARLKIYLEDLLGRKVDLVTPEALLAQRTARNYSTRGNTCRLEIGKCGLEIFWNASHESKNIKERHPDLPWVEMNTMRNIVIHEYHGVNLRIIWTTINIDLPPLVRQLKQILAEEE